MSRPISRSYINTVFIDYNRPFMNFSILGIHLLLLKKDFINIGEKLEPVDGVEPPTS